MQKLASVDEICEREHFGVVQPKGLHRPEIGSRRAPSRASALNLKFAQWVGLNSERTSNSKSTLELMFPVWLMIPKFAASPPSPCGEFRNRHTGPPRVE